MELTSGPGGGAWSGAGAWSRGGAGCLVLGGLVWSGGCLVETPRTATAAGGTHPTGMHSCLNSLYKNNCSHPDTPFGALPMLEVEGVTLCQQNTIIRFLANRFGELETTQKQKPQRIVCGSESIKIEHFDIF